MKIFRIQWSEKLAATVSAPTLEVAQEAFSEGLLFENIDPDNCYLDSELEEIIEIKKDDATRIDFTVK